MPSLADRAEEIPLFIEYFSESFKQKEKKVSFNPEFIRQLCQYDWPGNIRELRNVVERAIVMEDGPILRVHGPLGEGNSPDEALAGGESSRDLAAELGKGSLQDLLRDYKKSLIEAALKKSDGNQRRAAELLGLHRPSLTRMIKDLGLRDDS